MVLDQVFAIGAVIKLPSGVSWQRLLWPIALVMQ
jgi:hypothetical protein